MDVAEAYTSVNSMLLFVVSLCVVLPVCNQKVILHMTVVAVCDIEQHRCHHFVAVLD